MVPKESTDIGIKNVWYQEKNRYLYRKILGIIIIVQELDGFNLDYVRPVIFTEW